MGVGQTGLAGVVAGLSTNNLSGGATHRAHELSNTNNCYAWDNIGTWGIVTMCLTHLDEKIVESTHNVCGVVMYVCCTVTC